MKPLKINEDVLKEICFDTDFNRLNYHLNILHCPGIIGLYNSEIKILERENRARVISGKLLYPDTWEKVEAKLVAPTFSSTAAFNRRVKTHVKLHYLITLLTDLNLMYENLELLCKLEPIWRSSTEDRYIFNRYALTFSEHIVSNRSEYKDAAIHADRILSAYKVSEWMHVRDQFRDLDL